MKKKIKFIRTKVKKLLIIILSTLPVKKNKIVFQNFLGKGYGCNPKYIAEAIINNNEEYDLVWLCNDLESEIPSSIRRVRYGSLRSYYELATAKIWIDNVRNGLRVRKKQGQYYLQTWHGPFGFKCVEKDAEKLLSSEYVKSAKKDGKIINAILTNSSLQEEQYKRAFWLSEETEILRFGLPRNDFLVNNANNRQLKLDLRQKYGFSNNNYIILYAPTFRDDGSVKGYKLNFIKILEAFQQKFNKRCNLIIRLHPNVQQQKDLIDYGENIFDGSLYPDMQELAIISDCIISDYSTTLFDFSILNKPAFICALDLEEYAQKRGLLKEFYEFPFPHSYTNEDLINQIMDFDDNEYQRKITDYFSKNPVYDKGIAAHYVVEWIREKVKI